MSSKDKGKAVVDKWSPKKRKRDGTDIFGGRKQRNRGVLKFFDVSANVSDEDGCEDIELDDFLLDEEPEIHLIDKNKPSKSQNVPFLPKQEELCGDELERVLDKRYREGSGLVSFADDMYDSKRSIDEHLSIHFAKDPTIWKVKCMVGRERYSVFCLMQKYTDLKTLGKQLQIISAFTVDYIKGFIFIESNRQSNINEACNGICSIYFSRISLVPRNELSNLLSIRSKSNGISVGTWARVKNGHYKGDLAEVVAVNDKQKKATVRLIPRINLQALIDKLGGGVPQKRNKAPPDPRLISGRELEEFAPLIQHLHDPDTGIDFEVLDGLRFKNGFIYKKVSIESLSFCGVMPLEKELEKFKHSTTDHSDDIEWLNQLFGEQKRKRSRAINLMSDKGLKYGGKGSEKGFDKNSGKGVGNLNNSSENVSEDLGNTVEKSGAKGLGKGGIKGSGKGGEKSEEISVPSVAGGFDLHDFVCFGRKDFGVVVGMEKDNVYRILKEGPEGQAVVTAESRNMKHTPFDRKFTSLDQKMKTVSINDTVRIADGPSQGKEGVVKQIYRGILFLFEENETENNGFFCSKSEKCEKVNISGVVSNEKAEKAGLPSFGGFSTSPKSASSPKKQWDTEENNNEDKLKDRDGLFSVGQALRIKKGPLKGYLCRVLGIRRSIVTVKLDSQPKVLSVDAMHLSVVQEKNSLPTNVDPNSSLLGMEGGSTDWMEGGGATAGSSWNAMGNPSERSTWSNIPVSSTLPESNSENPFGSADNDSKTGDNTWGKTVTQKDSSSGGADEIGAWGKTVTQKDSASGGADEIGDDNWGKTVTQKDSSSGGADEIGAWGKTVTQKDSASGGADEIGDNWGKTVTQKDLSLCGADEIGSWNKTFTHKDSSSGGADEIGALGQRDDNWGKTVAQKDSSSGGANEIAAWGENANCFSNQDNSLKLDDPWDKGGNVSVNPDNSWAKSKGINDDNVSSWKQGGGASWGKSAGESSFEDQAGGSLWGKQDGHMDQENWDSSKSFEGDRGFGGRRGRGGKRGGRDGFGRGRSLGENNQSGGWNMGDNQQDSWSGREKNSSSWNTRDQGSGRGNQKADEEKQSGWNGNKASDGGVSSSAWGSNVNETSDGWHKNKNQQNTWNSFGNDRTEKDENECNIGRGGHWRGGDRCRGNSDWRGRGGAEQGRGDSGVWRGGRGRGGRGSFERGGFGGRGWGGRNGDFSSGWKNRSVANEESTESRAQGSDWRAGMASGNQNSSWKSGPEYVIGNKDCGWSSGKASDGNGGSGGWGGGKTSDCGGRDQEVITCWGSEKVSDGSGIEVQVSSGWGSRKTADCGGSGSGWGESQNWKGSGEVAGKASDGNGGSGGWGGGKTSDCGGRDQEVITCWGSEKVSDGSGIEVQVSSGWGSRKTADCGGSVGGWGGSQNCKGSGEVAGKASDGNGGSGGWGGGKTSDCGGRDQEVTSCWGSEKVSDGCGVEVQVSSGWGSRKTADCGGSGSGWGGSRNWKGSGEVAGEWNSSNTSVDEQHNRSGNWRGGRGERGGRFDNRGRGRFDRGGFRGRGNSERGGYRGRGRFEGRGRSYQSEDRGGSNDGRNSWSQGGGGSTWKSSAAPENNAGSTWKSSAASENNAGSTWKSSAAPENNAGSTWKSSAAPENNAGSTWKSSAAPENNAESTWKSFVAPENNGGSAWKSSAAPENNAGSTWKSSVAPENNAGSTWKSSAAPENNAGSTWKPPTTEKTGGDSWSQGGGNACMESEGDGGGSWKTRTGPSNNAPSSWSQGGGSSWKPRVAASSGNDAASQGGDGAWESQTTPSNVGPGSWKPTSPVNNVSSSSGGQCGGSTWKTTPRNDARSSKKGGGESSWE